MCNLVLFIFRVVVVSSIMDDLDVFCTFSYHRNVNTAPPKLNYCYCEVVHMLA